MCTIKVTRFSYELLRQRTFHLKKKENTYTGQEVIRKWGKITKDNFSGEHVQSYLNKGGGVGVETYSRQGSSLGPHNIL